MDLGDLVTRTASEGSRAVFSGNTDLGNRKTEKVERQPKDREEPEHRHVLLFHSRRSMHVLGSVEVKCSHESDTHVMNGYENSA